MHKLNIVHRDLKPDNIFLHNGICKIGDFSLAKELKQRDSMLKSICGTKRYAAPEIF